MAATPTTSAPSERMSLVAASTVPPVAMRSSTMSTRSPGLQASAWISIEALPYSRA